MINTKNINVLTVCRKIPHNVDIHKYPVAEFIFEQNKALEKLGITFDYYLIEKGGIKGYLSHAIDFIRFLKKNKNSYDIIHAHGGHMGSLANIQRKIPVVTSYHGSDINVFINRIIALIGLIFSAKRIYVSQKLRRKVKLFSGEIIPCGVDFNLFNPQNKYVCRNELGLNPNQKVVFFGGQKERPVKNYKLAKIVCDLARVDMLVELKGLSRPELVKMINACDCLLITSIKEGGPIIVKEALACNRPVVSVDVGDVKEITNHIPGTFVSDFDANTLAQNLTKSFEFDSIESREQIRHLDNQVIAQKIYKVYLSALKID